MKSPRPNVYKADYDLLIPPEDDDEPAPGMIWALLLFCVTMWAAVGWFVWWVWP